MSLVRSAHHHHPPLLLLTHRFQIDPCPDYLAGLPPSVTALDASHNMLESIAGLETLTALVYVACIAPTLASL